MGVIQVTNQVDLVTYSCVTVGFSWLRLRTSLLEGHTRPEDAGAGTKGLSLFYVPMYLFDPTTFALGERNGVCATGLEHKMGLKASPTCELTFGAHGRPAVGYLVSDVHNGIAQMFTVIEHARMTIG